MEKLNKGNMKKHIITLLLIVLASNIGFAQWTKGKGKGYYKLAGWQLQYDEHYTDTGAKDPNRTRTLFNTSLYAEYGVGNKFDVIAYVPFFASSSQNNQISGTTGETISQGETINSFGDVDLGFRYGLYKKGNWAADIKLILGLPTGDNNGGSDGSFQNGDGEFNQIISSSLGYSTSYKDKPVYLKSYLGYNNRSEGFSDEFRTGLEAGINLINNKLWLITRLNVVKSFKNGSLNATNSNGSIFANDIEYSSFGFETAYYITKKLGVSLGFDSAFSGRIIAASPSFSGGIFLDIK